MKTVLLIFLFFTCSSLAQQPPFYIYHIKHESIENVYLPYIKKAYLDLGIKAQFVETTIERRLRELERGNADAVLTFTMSEFKLAPKSILVEPKLAEAQVILICIKQLSCSDNDLKNPALTLVVAEADLLTLPHKSSDIKNRIYKMDSYGGIINMMVKGRADLAIYTIDKNVLPSAIGSRFKHSVLLGVDVFHALSTKHAELQSALSDSLTSNLPYLKQLKEKSNL